MKMHGCIDSHFLDLITGWKLMAKLSLRPLYPYGNFRMYALYSRLSRPQRRSGRRGEKKILDPTKTRTPTRLLCRSARGSSYVDRAIYVIVNRRVKRKEVQNIIYRCYWTTTVLRETRFWCLMFIFRVFLSYIMS
jgi:hypothetical protein